MEIFMCNGCQLTIQYQKTIENIKYERITPYNRVARPTSKHWQGEALTPLYVRVSYTAVH